MPFIGTHTKQACAPCCAHTDDEGLRVPQAGQAGVQHPDHGRALTAAPGTTHQGSNPAACHQANITCSLWCLAATAVHKSLLPTAPSRLLPHVCSLPCAPSRALAAVRSRPTHRGQEAGQLGGRAVAGGVGVEGQRGQLGAEAVAQHVALRIDDNNTSGACWRGTLLTLLPWMRSHTGAPGPCRARWLRIRRAQLVAAQLPGTGTKHQ